MGFFDGPYTQRRMAYEPVGIDSNAALQLCLRELLGAAQDCGLRAPDKGDLRFAFGRFLRNANLQEARSLDLYAEGVHLGYDDASAIIEYADLLWRTTGVSAEAEKLYRRAMRLEPNSPVPIANLAQIRFASGDLVEGEALALKSLELTPESHPMPDSFRQCLFYLFCHVPSRRSQAGGQLHRALAAGGLADYWSFESDLRIVRLRDEPRYPMLICLADVLNGDEVEVLEQFSEWRALASVPSRK